MEAVILRKYQYRTIRIERYTRLFINLDLENTQEQTNKQMSFKNLGHNYSYAKRKHDHLYSSYKMGKSGRLLNYLILAITRCLAVLDRNKLL